ncbi:hypothetical protein PIB30_095701 [Stylosanthes scabra]|uniref:Protein FAR1-RELATED SEQUENCE n=1 Tax=Stylosanthes scabra TaxID=79078 RepID=A0ABU6WU10_9FABA|nr:hypothetical protein [Stylosanthes scabra]
MFRDVQLEFIKKGDCIVHVMSQEGDMYSLEVEEQKLVFDKSVFDLFRVNEAPTCYILSRWSKNVRCKHTYIKSSHDVNRSDERHNLFRGLRSHFYNVAQDFLCNKEEALILHSSMDNARIKLGEYRATKLQSSIPVQQSCGAQGSQCSISVD